MVLISRWLSLNGIGWNTRAKSVIFIGLFRSFFVSRIRPLKVRLSARFCPG